MSNNNNRGCFFYDLVFELAFLQIYFFLQEDLIIDKTPGLSFTSNLKNKEFI